MLVPNELTHGHHDKNSAGDAAEAENLFTAAGMDTGSTVECVEWGYY